MLSPHQVLGPMWFQMIRAVLPILRRVAPMGQREWNTGIGGERPATCGPDPEVRLNRRPRLRRVRTAATRLCCRAAGVFTE